MRTSGGARLVPTRRQCRLLCSESQSEMTNMQQIWTRRVPFSYLHLILFATSLMVVSPGQLFSQQAAPASQKVIKDPAEYNAYITALNTQDPAQKGAAMEAFIAQYPASVVRSDAMEQAMSAYQQ